ncbi:type VII secretion integral membrane protein EccD [Kribbella catacumbae]|uniref:type VII secretion integral membrane protein EccD n=1 Tax=Kribbella catacumbae TaxID=460086 RepID=UPI00036A7B36|nr:type VII secretion integral membrane protein EccD [Kribbella catacumbae]
MSTRGLVKVTIDAAERRIDLALPDRSTVAELLPSILRHAGDGLADEGAQQGGWVLRRHDGDALETHQDLASQQVRDGEILHLAPARQQWPELEYDDIVDAIAIGARGGGREWTRGTTRWFGLVIGSAAIVAALVIQLRPGPPWGTVPAFALAVAALLLIAGTLLTRVAGDASAGMVAGAVGVVCAGVGGALLLAGDYRLSELGAPHLTTAGAALLLAGLAGYVGIAKHTAVFVAACTTGILATAAGLLATGWLDSTRAAAVVAAVAVAMLPAAAPLAMRIGRLPKPVLPNTTADLLSDAPQPPREALYAAVLRTAALYTGILAGLAIGLAACLLALSRSESTSATILVLLVVGVCLLRSRLLPVVSHRLSLLITGLAGAACLVLPDPGTPTPYGLVAFAAAVVFLGLWYAGHKPSAYFARYAELAEILLVLFVVPVLMSVLGLYGYVRGLGG